MVAPNFPTVPIAAPGTSILAATSVSRVVGLPVCSDGGKPRFIRVMTTGSAFIRLAATTSGTATTGDTLINSSNEIFLNASGFNFLAVQSQTGSSTVQISPVDIASALPSTTPSGS